MTAISHPDDEDRHRYTWVSGGSGLQVGDHNQMYITYSDSGPRWPLRMGAVPRAADCYQDRDGDAAMGQALEPFEIDALEELAIPKTTVVTGMGGVGKTQTAARQVRQLWANGLVDLAVWITAMNRDAIVAGYAQAAQAVGCSTDEDPQRAATALLGWLSRTDRRWVIVLDDLRNPDHLKNLWPESAGNGHTVITTRRRDATLLRTDHRIIEVTPFTEAESLSYLRAKLAGQPALLNGAVELADVLGNLPLALAQAVAYLIDADITCEAYRHRFLARRQVIPDSLPDDHQHTVNTTWQLSIELADKLHPTGLARPLLELLSLLDPNGVPTALVTSAPMLSYLGERTGQRVEPDDAKSAVRCLHRLSLATIDTEQAERGIRVHTLVQHTTRAETLIRDEDIIITAANALLDVWPADGAAQISLAQSLWTNTIALEHHAAPYLHRPELHELRFRLGRSLGAAGLTRSAAEHFERLCATATKQFGPDNSDTMILRAHTAYYRGLGGDLPRAIAELEQLTADQQRALGKKDRDPLYTRCLLAQLRDMHGDTRRAMAELTRVLDDQTMMLDNNHPDTWETRRVLAGMQHAIGDVSAAVTNYEQLLESQTSSLAADHRDILNTLSQLAELRHELGDKDGAIADLEQVLAAQRAALGKNHSDTLETRGKLAEFRGENGDIQGAIADLEQVLEDCMQVLGEAHPHTGRIRGSLASFRQAGGDIAGAITELERSRASEEQYLGNEHELTLRTRSRLAATRWHLDRTAAMPELQQIVDDYMRVLGADHPETLLTRYGLAAFHVAGGDMTYGISELEHVHAELARVLGPNHPHTTEVRWSLDALRRPA